MQKLSTKWVPKRLSTDQKCERCQPSEQLLEAFRHNPNDFLSQLVTMDKTWLYHYDPETKQQLVEWQHSSSPSPKKFRVQKSAGIVLALIFGIKRAPTSLIIFQRATLSTRSITHLCWCIWRTFLRKNADRGKVIKGVLFLHDNAPSHQALATHKKLAYLGFQCLDHPPYSTDLALLDYHLFPGLKKQLKNHHFSSVTVVFAAMETWLDGQPSKFFLSGLQKSEQWAKKCTELRREYVE